MQMNPPNRLLLSNFDAMKKRMEPYQNKAEKPYLHLVDGGLTDNLGLASLLMCQIYLVSENYILSLRIIIYVILSW